MSSSRQWGSTIREGTPAPYSLGQTREPLVTEFLDVTESEHTDEEETTELEYEEPPREETLAAEPEDSTSESNSQGQNSRNKNQETQTQKTTQTKKMLTWPKKQQHGRPQEMGRNH